MPRSEAVEQTYSATAVADDQRPDDGKREVEFRMAWLHAPPAGCAARAVDWVRPRALQQRRHGPFCISLRMYQMPIENTTV